MNYLLVRRGNMAQNENPYGKFVGLAAPVALVSAILYLHLYWYSFGIVIFEFLSFGALIGYSIVPVLFAVGILFFSFGLVFVVKRMNLPRWAQMLVLGLVGIAFGIRAWFIGIHVLWILLPLVGAPLAAGGLDFIKFYHSVVPDSTVRIALSFSVCFVLLSGAAAGKMQAGGVLSRTDYYTVDILPDTTTGLSSRGVRWVYVGKADDLVFLLSERDSSIVISKIDAVTPFVFTHHRKILYVKRLNLYGVGDRETRDSSFVAQRRNEIAMSQLLRFPSSVKRDPAIEVWMHEHSGELGAIAQSWFEVMRDCGDDVRELLHDGHPTACVGDAAFAYVNAFKAHVNVGFFRGAEIADPEGLLEGTGKFMRHVKLRPERDVDATALMKLIETAYIDMKGRLKAE